MVGHNCFSCNSAHIYHISQSIQKLVANDILNVALTMSIGIAKEITATAPFNSASVILKFLLPPSNSVMLLQLLPLFLKGVVCRKRKCKMEINMEI